MISMCGREIDAQMDNEIWAYQFTHPEVTIVNDDDTDEGRSIVFSDGVCITISMGGGTTIEQL